MKKCEVLYLVIPCYNEEEVLPETAKRLTEKLNTMIERNLISPDSKMVFVNDGSKDRTWPIIQQLHETNPLVWGINLSRNKGHQNALLAGLMTVKEYADMAISLDADLQDDLKAIEEMVDRYNEGYDIVYGVKISRDADSFMKRNTALVFYKLQRSLGVKAIHNHADFRLMSRRALEQLSHFKERNLYLRGLVPLIGYKSTTVDDAISERTAGKSKYTLKKMLALAMDML